ncbi:MAG: hypothetical protein ACI35R_06930 [Bacillus sp. (in: firmicutes)]
MVEYIVDLALIAVLVVGSTALNGVIAHTIGVKLFGGRKKNVHLDASMHTQKGWKQVGGK